MSEAPHIVAETARRIFTDLGDPQAVNRASDDDWRLPLWRALEKAGLTLAMSPEEFGGAGGSLAEAFEIIAVAGRHAVAIPLVETMLAGWLLANAGLTSPAGMMTVAPVRPRDWLIVNDDGSISGRASGIPFTADAEHIAVLASAENESVIALIARADVHVDESRGLTGEASDVTFARAMPRASARAPAGFNQSALMLMGAIARSIESAGALETVLAMCVRYANERVAFEKPIGKFQAVQQSLARLAGETAAALAAAGSAADTLAQGARFDDKALFLEAAAAKIRTAEAAAEGAAIAHQVHGAIGFTSEHVLHRFTLRLLGWRDDFGNESHWAVELGKLVARNGSDEFWPMLAAR